MIIGRRGRSRALALLLLHAPLVLGCSGSGSDSQESTLSASFLGPSPAAASDTVFFSERRAAGDLITLDVMARSIAAPLEGFDLAISFDPSIVEAFGVGDATVLGRCFQTRPDNTQLICQDNLSGNANSSGLLLFSASTSVSPAPAPSQVIGDERLATITFRARRRGRSSIDFYVAARPVPGLGSYSQVISMTDPASAALVAFEPDAPGLAFIKVVRR